MHFEMLIGVYSRVLFVLLQVSSKIAYEMPVEELEKVLGGCMRVPLGPGSMPLAYVSRLQKFGAECSPQCLFALRQAGGEIQIQQRESVLVVTESAGGAQRDYAKKAGTGNSILLFVNLCGGI